MNSSVGSHLYDIQLNRPLVSCTFANATLEEPKVKAGSHTDGVKSVRVQPTDLWAQWSVGCWGMDLSKTFFVFPKVQYSEELENTQPYQHLNPSNDASRKLLGVTWLRISRIQFCCEEGSLLLSSKGSCLWLDPHRYSQRIRIGVSRLPR